MYPPRYLIIDQEKMIHVSPLKEACQVEIMSINHRRPGVSLTKPSQPIIHHLSREIDVD